jgi:predicted hydrolase (HD superfamily)
MDDPILDRERAWRLLCEYTKTEPLRRHGLSVEQVMRAAAVKYGENPDRWGIVGLLHDFDYEAFPEQHPLSGEPILRAHGYPEDIIRAIKGHADFLDIDRQTPMEKMIFAVDELTGFVIACALVQPDRSLSSVKVPSVRKKLKDKSFARNVLRQDIFKGAEELGVELDDQIAFVVDALKPVARLIGLNE